MTKKEFSAAVALAQSNVPLLKHSSELLCGFGLPDFKPVNVSIFAAAECIRWQCSYVFSDGWDNAAMEECWRFFRHRVNIIGFGDHNLMDPEAAAEQIIAGVLWAELLK